MTKWDSLQPTTATALAWHDRWRVTVVNAAGEAVDRWELLYPADGQSAISAVQDRLHHDFLQVVGTWSVDGPTFTAAVRPY